jgi:hypothetical protein
MLKVELSISAFEISSLWHLGPNGALHAVGAVELESVAAML